MKLYNTASQSLENFVPLNDKSVTMYTCGPTVYSEPLIGNWAAYIRWDILVRVLLAQNYTVHRVMNITDVGHLTSDADEGEDKMIKGARREGITEWDVAERYTNSFLNGMKLLNLIMPEHVTKATDHIEIQIKLIQTLENKGYTYQINDGVYFDTSKFPEYGAFAKLDLEAQKAGARVAFNSEKKNLSDFVLWRLTPQGQSRTMEWDSPWGRGIPGWHIECSAMAIHYLGETIDIHTGGIDHIPVHHTNEIAQSEAATGKQFARFWLHSNFLLSEGTKISKSLGNGYSITDIINQGFDPLDYKMFILQSHYRTESNFSWDNLQAAHNRLARWRKIAELRWQLHDTLIDDDTKDELHSVNGIILAAPHAARTALQNDLNTPQALTHIESAFDAIEATNTNQIQHAALQQLIKEIDTLFGLDMEGSTPDIDDETKQLIVRRQRAREDKDWQLSDELREELIQKGVNVRDTGSRSFWSRN